MKGQGHCEQSAFNKALPVWAAHNHPPTHIANTANNEAVVMWRQRLRRLGLRRAAVVGLANVTYVVK